ncbi:MAG: CCA tRNA nucleotidyltransferase [Victivallaceae bacterium]
MNEMFLKNKIGETGAGIVRKLRTAGFAAYFVGGAVRDMLLGKMPQDIDIVTSALPEQTAELFPNNQQVGACFGIILVVENGINFEVATFREERNYLDGRHPESVKYTDNPEIDVLRRDFTINGMLYDPLTGEIIDYVGGRNDLAAGILRTIGEAELRFNEDYLRMLRAVRFASRFGFELDDAAFKAISLLKDKIKSLPAERIREEFNLMLTGPAPASAVRMLYNAGLLEVFLPEVAALAGVQQPEMYHPEGDVFEHTLLMLEHMAVPGVELAWSILLHDVGKPETFSIDENGIEHFYRHEFTGAELAVQIMERLRFSISATGTVTEAVKNHMRFAFIDKMRVAKWKRLLASPDFSLELELHRIDCIASNGKLENFVLMLDRINDLRGEIALPEPLITGKDLIASGFRPGPLFSEILEQVRDAQLSGEIENREAALDFVSCKFSVRKKNA